jgi:hypothetical protein
LVIPNSATTDPIAVASASSVNDVRNGRRVRFLNRNVMNSIGKTF